MAVNLLAQDLLPRSLTPQSPRDSISPHARLPLPHPCPDRTASNKGTKKASRGQVSDGNVLAACLKRCEPRSIGNGRATWPHQRDTTAPMIGSTGSAGYNNHRRTKESLGRTNSELQMLFRIWALMGNQNMSTGDQLQGCLDDNLEASFTSASIDRGNTQYGIYRCTQHSNALWWYPTLFQHIDYIEPTNPCNIIIGCIS